MYSFINCTFYHILLESKKLRNVRYVEVFQIFIIIISD